jgi:5-methylcytosine-specific restriction endonuclease McrA
MKSYSLSHLADRTLLQALATLVTQDLATTAALLAHLGEVDERRLYRSAAYPSMYIYCVHELRMSEDTAFKRIRAARTAREFPAIYVALAEGRLHLSAVVLLAPHLTPETANELLVAAEHKTKAEIELLLAQRFPLPDLPTFVGAIAAPAVSGALAARSVGAPSELWQLAPGPVAGIAEAPTPLLAPEPAGLSGPRTPVPEASIATRAKFAPLSPGRYALQVTVDQETHDLLRYAQALLGHAVPSGDVATVLQRALGALVHQLEQQKFAKSSRSRPRHSSAKDRYIPAVIRRTIWQHDGGRCTFVSERGERCESTTRLEFDHIDPVARGGETSAARMRLRCRAHNQYAAECTFGVGFMRGKRDEARCRAARERVQAQTSAQKCALGQAQERAQARASEQAQPRAQAVEESSSHLDVRPWLRQLGFSADEARRGAALCAHIPDAPLEQRVRVALRGLAPNCVRKAAPMASSPA